MQPQTIEHLLHTNVNNGTNLARYTHNTTVSRTSRFGHPSHEGDHVARATLSRHPDIDGIIIGISVGLCPLSANHMTAKQIDAIEHLFLTMLDDDLDAIGSAGQTVTGIVIDPLLTSAQADAPLHHDIKTIVHKALGAHNVGDAPLIGIAPYAVCPSLRALLNRAAIFIEANISNRTEAIALYASDSSNETQPYSKRLGHITGYQRRCKRELVVGHLAGMVSRGYQIDSRGMNQVSLATLGRELKLPDLAYIDDHRRAPAISLYEPELGIVSEWLCDLLNEFDHGFTVALQAARHSRSLRKQQDNKQRKAA